MSLAEAALPLTPLCMDLKPEAESLPFDVCLQEVKFVLNPVLPLHHFLGSLARLGLAPAPICRDLKPEV